ncbi:uncharacterized protein MONBRDRAFT_10547 [Monosiga brevicollis MX1]|uniref:Apple domain-containing protein n=1 Tax=Monosiga brevicollis TaxID=81824 RepID=A9V6P4_MONBE|nr:uncharacterized protein MONBRDRAFT_10547 [Monosiga brevicollis MX1]EDQ86841.1 predicted protein [Monosiga brevicollis MX1]|eukprot:XP_001748386.1 hypothetical protein [Monosiga brevicollis MX1]
MAAAEFVLALVAMLTVACFVTEFAQDHERVDRADCHSSLRQTCESYCLSNSACSWDGPSDYEWTCTEHQGTDIRNTSSSGGCGSRQIASLFDILAFELLMLFALLFLLLLCFRRARRGYYAQIVDHDGLVVHDDRDEVGLGASGDAYAAADSTLPATTPGTWSSERTGWLTAALLELTVSLGAVGHLSNLIFLNAHQTYFHCSKYTTAEQCALVEPGFCSFNKHTATCESQGSLFSSTSSFDSLFFAYIVFSCAAIFLTFGHVLLTVLLVLFESYKLCCGQGPERQTLGQLIARWQWLALGTFHRVYLGAVWDTWHNDDSPTRRRIVAARRLGDYRETVYCVCVAAPLALLSSIWSHRAQQPDNASVWFMIMAGSLAILFRLYTFSQSQQHKVPPSHTTAQDDAFGGVGDKELLIRNSGANDQDAFA